MPDTLANIYPTLWHYTTGAGLEGILKSQQLWATNMRYLNDDEELRGFFERKLPILLQKGIDVGIDNILGLPRYEEMIKIAGDHDGIKQHFFDGLHKSLTAATLELEVFVTSFCFSSPDIIADGLLSQWRGYGPDGGYAFVFDCKGLTDLIEREHEQYKYPFLNFSDVDYHYEDWESNANRHEETLEWESQIRQIISGLVEEGNFIQQAEKLYEPILALAIRHKHKGFKEEQEIRIAAVCWPKKAIITTEELNPLCSKSINFCCRSGILIPYISLFDGIPEKERKLPIKEIVIGPHPDKLKRQKSVQMLLEELEIESTVRVSDIPYLGR